MNKIDYMKNSIKKQTDELMELLKDKENFEIKNSWKEMSVIEERGEEDEL